MDTKRISAALVVAIATSCGAIAAFGGCNGTGGGDTGDKIPRSRPDVLGDGQRINEVVGPATWYDAKNTTSTNCALPLTTPVSLTGQVIVGVDRFDETGTGQVGNIYIEDVPVEGADPVPYSGVTVFGAAFTPPDLRVFEGDVVDTLGTYDEFPGPSSGPFSNCITFPEASGTLTFRFENGNRAAAEIVATGTDPSRWEVVTGYANARPWLGMLVKFNDVTLPRAPRCGKTVPDCTHLPPGFKDRYTIDIDMGPAVPNGSPDVIQLDNELFDLTSLNLQPGQHLKSVTGVLTYFYQFHVAPRSAADIEL